MGKRVVAMRVLFVPFQFQRHTLLAHEYQFAYAACLEAGFVPVAEADGK